MRLKDVLEAELLPCPFCGNARVNVYKEDEEGAITDINDERELESGEYSFVVCCSIFTNGCGASSGKSHNVEETITKWGTRANMSEEYLIPQFEKKLRDLEKKRDKLKDSLNIKNRDQDGMGNNN